MSSLLSVLVLAAALAPADGAVLTGVVRDAASGEPLQGARVVLADLERSTTTGADGRYLLDAVPAGPQHLEVRRLGYESRTVHALVPPAGRMEINFSLRPLPVALEALSVAPRVAVRGGEAVDADRHPGVELSAAAVRNHPLLAEPDFFAALAGGAVLVQPEAPRGLHVWGGSADQVTFLLDGSPVLTPYHAAGQFSAWNPDAISTLRLETIPPVAVAPDALSGVVAGETRRPGPELRAQGAFSSTQARGTLDGPLPGTGLGFLLSGRAGFPGVPNPTGENSYVRGSSSDWLATLQGRIAGGGFRLLGYENRNRTGTAVGFDGEVPSARRNRFAWDGRSWGAEWRRDVGGGRMAVRAWAASADASASWESEDPGFARLAANRDDVGGAVFVELGDSAAGTLLGVRANRSRTGYRVGPAGGGAPTYRLDAETDVAGAFATHSRSLGPRAGVEVGVLAASFAGEPRLAPQVRVRWSPRPALALSAGASRSYQAEQSLRNPESVVSYVFPAGLHTGAGAPGVPVGRSDQAFVAAQLQAAPEVRVGAQAYARGFDGLVLVAPSTAHPFATGPPAAGSGTSRGAALDLTVSGACYAVVGSYGYQDVRLTYGDTTYVPDFAARHILDLGVILFPQASASVHASLSSALGRRTTALTGRFEWEPCNLLDRGCEFAGSPQRRDEPLGSTRLPSYLRVDVGARKHWHLRIGGRDALLGLYASATNLLGRENLLTAAVDPETGEREWIGMSSRAPLVVGIDWRF